MESWALSSAQGRRMGTGMMPHPGTRVGPAGKELSHLVIKAGWERLFLSQEHFKIWDIFLLLGSAQPGRGFGEPAAPGTMGQPGTSLHPGIPHPQQHLHPPEQTPPMSWPWS